MSLFSHAVKLNLISQKKYPKLNHFRPKGYAEVFLGIANEVQEMVPYLSERASKGWTKIPNHDVELFLVQHMNVPSLAFRKGMKKEAYFLVFCNEFVNQMYAMGLVFNLYIKLQLEKPDFLLEEPNWIHSISLPGIELNSEETLLVYQIAQAVFRSIFMKYKV